MATAQIVNQGQVFVGQKLTFTASFFNEAGVLADPTTVKFISRNNGAQTTYVYLTDPQVTKTSVGVYAFAMPQITVAGSWLVRCNGSGAVTSSSEVSFTAVATEFSPVLP